MEEDIKKFRDYATFSKAICCQIEAHFKGDARQRLNAYLHILNATLCASLYMYVPQDGWDQAIDIFTKELKDNLHLFIQHGKPDG